MIFPALIGAAASIGGSMLSKSKPGGFKFRPGGTNLGIFGSSEMDKKGNVLTKAGEGATGAQRSFMNQLQGFQSDPFNQQQFGGETLGMGQGLFNPAFQNAQAAGFDMSNAGVGQFLQQNQNLQGMFQGAGMAGVNAAFGAPGAQGVSDQAGMMAQGLLGQTDLSQLAADRTAQLTELARPGEETATNQKFQNLFGSGRLGTTGGAQALGELQQAQQLAGTQRGLAGMDFANQVRNQNLGFGSQFLGQQLQGIGQDQQQAQFLGNLGMQNLNQLPGLNQTNLGALVGMDERGVSRGQQRLQNVENLFGFAQNQLEAPVGAASRTLAGMQPLFNNQLALGNQAIQASQARSGSQGASSGSPVGSALSGMGAGLFNQGMKSFFNKGDE